jgi:hypothetical protein
MLLYLLLPRNPNEKETKRLMIWKGYGRSNIMTSTYLIPLRKLPPLPQHTRYSRNWGTFLEVRWAWGFSN